MTTDRDVSQATVTAPAQYSAPLTRGLARNTLFNLIGWAWPVVLSFLAVPYIVSGLGNDAYGVFGIAGIAAGYLAMLNTPVATGNIRFIADAYGRRDWDELRNSVITGTAVTGVLAGCAALVMFLAAKVLAEHIFKIPDALVDNAAICFRIAAVSLLMNGVASSLNGVLAAIRRYDVLNLVSLIVGSLNTVGIVLALYLGWGLVGAVIAQMLSSTIAVVCFGALVWAYLHRLPASSQLFTLDRLAIRRLLSFSSFLFGGHVASQVGLQIDRALVGILLGASAVTFYTVPARITDRIPGLIGRLTLALYPLSAEGVASGQLDTVRRLYRDMVRVTLWVSGWLATMVIISAREILSLWVSAEIADNSWLVLVLLTAGVIWRGPGGVAFHVGSGLGRGDFYLGMSLITLPALAIPTILFTYSFGVAGAALGMFLGLAVVNVTYDILTQRKLLGQHDWLLSLSPYVRVALAMTSTLLVTMFLPMEVRNWAGLLMKTSTVSVVFMILSLLFGVVRRREIGFAISTLKARVHW
jgi:O-antigen/teichoic acid export membrane protein